MTVRHLEVAVIKAPEGLPPLDMSPFVGMNADVVVDGQEPIGGFDDS